MWIWAIEEAGNRHWYKLLPRSRKKTLRGVPKAAASV
jgi:hypothetical protein